MSRPHVVILGAGFAGLSAARRLASESVDVTLLDRNDYHLFTPLLYQVATTMLDPSQIAQPIRSLVRHCNNISFRLAEARAVDLNARVVVTDPCRVPYDFLVLAAGSVSNYYGNLELERNSLGLKQLSDALELRDRVLTRFEEAHWETDRERRRELLTFAVVGGGPPGSSTRELSPSS